MNSSGQWNYFHWDDFECKHTGFNEMNHDFIDRLDELRERVGFALPVTSGYRHPSHPAEAHKPNGGGMHTLGIAADLACRGERMYIVVAEAILMGFTGIGVGKGFVHLDDRAGPPLMWGY